MTIPLTCSGCGDRMQAPDSLAGQKVRCPNCQTVLTVPEPVYEAEEIPEGSPPPPPVRPRPLGIPSRPSDEPQVQVEEEEERRPCPMCGEMIMVSARKCRFCGEIFDPGLRRQAGSPQEQRTFRTLMNGLGALWIFFACGGFCVLLAGIVAVSDRGADESDVAPMIFFVVTSLCWLVFGICTCRKQIWSVYAGLVFSYLGALGTLAGIVRGADRGQTSAVAVSVFALCLIGAGIVQAHRGIALSGRMNQPRRLSH
jgi:predicted RNA-binding Zn-ribbon protein involved in translation (DUF1610 family)/uncharacterized membrane protein HdeD (DUF308 family)